MIAHWGVRALIANVFSLLEGILEPPHTTNYTIVVVSGGLEFLRCEAPSQILVLTELRELDFKLERPT